MTENDPERLNELDARLKAARERADGPAKSAKQDDAQGDSQMAATGARMSLELVVGIVFGLGLGWFIDRGLGTKPWFMIIFMFLGLAAGVVNIVRMAKSLQRDQK
jgi:ATP synthase protein I